MAGRTIAALDGNDATLGSNLAVTSAKLSIDGTSTVHDYSLSTTTLTVNSTTVSIEGAAALLQAGALQTFELQIPVKSFTSEKDGLKERMLKALQAEKHPVITFRMTSYVVEPSPSGGTIVKPTGTLTVAGVERPIDLVLDVREHAGGLKVRGSRDLTMTEFGIKPPTMMMGMLKTNDKITIKFDLQLTLASQMSANKGQ
jgi:polyisoprenoid-binding protein YceI